MSVAALVTYRQRKESEYIPLATESSFYENWIPIARKYDLKWVTLFASGVFIEPEDIGEVISEIDQIEQVIVASSSPSEVKQHVVDRVRDLKHLLQNINIDDVREIYIG